jgi:hypothetical protein
VVLRPSCAAALVVRRMYFILAPRPFTAAPLVVRRRCLIVVPMPMPEAPCMYLIVVYRTFPATPLVVRCMYMALVPGQMPAAVASRYCRRRFRSVVDAGFNSWLAPRLTCGSMLEVSRDAVAAGAEELVSCAAE